MGKHLVEQWSATGGSWPKMVAGLFWSWTVGENNAQCK